MLRRQAYLERFPNLERGFREPAKPGAGIDGPALQAGIGEHLVVATSRDVAAQPNWGRQRQ